MDRTVSNTLLKMTGNHAVVEKTDNRVISFSHSVHLV